MKTTSPIPSNVPLIKADKLDNVPYNEFADFVKSRSAKFHEYFKSWGLDEKSILETLWEIKCYGNGAGEAILHYYQRIYNENLYQLFLDEFPSPKMKTGLDQAFLIE